MGEWSAKLRHTTPTTRPLPRRRAASTGLGACGGAGKCSSRDPLEAAVVMLEQLLLARPQEGIA